MATAFDGAFVPLTIPDLLKPMVQLRHSKWRHRERGRGSTRTESLTSPVRLRLFSVRCIPFVFACSLYAGPPPPAPFPKVGESERAVARAFANARQCAPCVLLLDEIDALFGRKETDTAMSPGHSQVQPAYAGAVGPPHGCTW